MSIWGTPLVISIGTLPPAPNPYLTFTEQNGTPFILRLDGGNDDLPYWDGVIQYSATDPTDPEEWSDWDGTSDVYSSNDGVLYLRGIGNSVITSNASAMYTSYFSFLDTSYSVSSIQIECSGNIETLLDYETVMAGQHPQMGSRCYYSMFQDCTTLVIPPQLPATTLTELCYASMFYNCTSLTSAPELPATTLADGCYTSMFELCTSLAIPPALPATTLAEGCYGAMFAACYSLDSLPALPATTLVTECYFSMFSNCLGLVVTTSREDVTQEEFRIPTAGTGIDTGATTPLDYMFDNISSDSTVPSTPTINTTYYVGPYTTPK